jgi:membrane protein
MSRVAPHRTGLLSFGIVTSLWLTSKGFKGVIAGLDIAYNVQKPRSIWTNRILAFGLAFAVGLLLLLGVVLTLAGPILEALISRVVPIQSLWLRVWPYVQWCLSALFIFAAIELLYRLAPNVPAKQRLTIPGAMVATAIWLALAWGLGYYFHHFGDLKFDRLYELLASPIALIVWLYWSAIAILIGAEINVNLRVKKEVRTMIPGSVSNRSDAA